jgi:hypothetical protein
MLKDNRFFSVLLIGIILLSPYAFSYEYSFIKIDALKIAANGSVDVTIGKGYKAGLVAFSGLYSNCPHGICSYSTLTSNSSTLHSQINSYDPMGQTCISCGINKARQLLAAASGEKYMVVLSDGVPNSCISADGGACTESQGKQESLQHAGYAFAEGMKVYAVALGDDADNAFLKNLSAAGGGKFYNVSCTRTLEQIYKNISENEAFDNLMLVSDVSGSMLTELSFNCTTTTTTTTTTSTTTTLQNCSATPDTALSIGNNSIDFQTPHDYPGNMDCYSGVYSCPGGYYSRIYAKYDTETWYDFFYIYDNITQNSTVFYGNSSGFIWLNPQNVSFARFRFSSDASNNRWGVDVDAIECYWRNETTTSTTTTSTTTTTNSSTTTTTQGPCLMPGNNPPCAEVTLEEVIAAINKWMAGNMELASVIDLIKAWSGGSTPN